MLSEKQLAGIVTKAIHVTYREYEHAESRREWRAPGSD